jgi:hypothetical protein
MRGNNLKSLSQQGCFKHPSHNNAESVEGHTLPSPGWLGRSGQLHIADIKRTIAYAGSVPLPDITLALVVFDWFGFSRVKQYQNAIIFVFLMRLSPDPLETAVAPARMVRRVVQWGRRIDDEFEAAASN